MIFGTHVIVARLRELQGQGAADTERLKDAMRKAIAVLQAAVGS